MLLIDDLLMLPFSGFGFVLRTIQRTAEEQYTDDAPVKERLLELQLKLESEEISEEEYALQEATIIRQLREIENRKRQLAGAPSLFTRIQNVSFRRLRYGRTESETEYGAKNERGLPEVETNPANGALGPR